MKSESDAGPVGSPLAEGAKAVLATVVAMVPGPGTLVSAALWGALQAETTRRLNAALQKLQEAIDASGRSSEQLLQDDAFRAGVAQLCTSAVTQEAESKLERIHNFLVHRLRSPSAAPLLPDAVLRAFAALPASHIESFLSMVADNEADLRDFTMVLGEQSFDLDKIVQSEFRDAQDQDHCGSPADQRTHELEILFGSLESAGLLTRAIVFGKNLVFETTALAKDFVRYCLAPADAV